MLKDYYRDFGITRVPKELLKNQELYNLYKSVKKDKGKAMPTFQRFAPGLVQQADLLFMPQDKQYKYALVLIDNGSRKVEAEPLKSKKSNDVKKGFESIYKRNVLTIPKKIEVDAGTEFKGDVASYFEKKHVDMRIAKRGRHRQQALVERANQTIGTSLLKRMTAQELLTGEPSREWVSEIKSIIESMNKRVMKPRENKNETIIVEPSSKELLPIGTKVRVALDDPVETTSLKEKRLPGRFRAGDPKWSQTVRTIKEILMKPNFPPMYLLNGNVGDSQIEPVAYTRNQLQVIPENEEAPDPSVIRGKPTTYVIEKIIKKVKVGRTYKYEVKWKGYTNTTMETKTSLQKDVPDMLKEFELKLKDI